MRNSSNGPSRDAPKFVVRLYDELHQRIHEMARAHHRSMNAEILHALESHADTEMLKHEFGIRERALITRISSLEECLSLVVAAVTKDNFKDAASIAQSQLIV